MILRSDESRVTFEHRLVAHHRSVGRRWNYLRRRRGNWRLPKSAQDQMRSGSVAAGAGLLPGAAVDGCVGGSDGACHVVERRGFSSGCATQRSGSNNGSVDCSVRARARPAWLRPRADRSGWSTPRQLQRLGGPQVKPAAGGAYLQRDRIAQVLDAGADIVVRAGWNNARWPDSKANRLALIPLLKKARGKGFIDRPIWIKGSPKQPIAL